MPAKATCPASLRAAWKPTPWKCPPVGATVTPGTTKAVTFPVAADALYRAALSTEGGGGGLAAEVDDHVTLVVHGAGAEGAEPAERRAAGGRGPLGGSIG